MAKALTPRWTLLRPHDGQQQLWDSTARFKIVPAGRRSGKTELAKRNLILQAMAETRRGVRYLALAPTHAQAKEIFWRDLIALTPAWLLRGRPNWTELTITLLTGTTIRVAGLDRGERIEGGRLVGGVVIDEIANCSPDAWPHHVFPTLSEGRGWAWLIGVPEGRNHYHDLYLRGVAREGGLYESHTWHSSTVLPPEEVAIARAGMDTRTFRQEYEGSFESFEGRAYYDFGPENLRSLTYDPKRELVFCFDFNTAPGVAAIVQEHEIGTCVIGEVWVERNSNTPLICRRLAQDWGHHQGRVVCRGDATGGAKKTSSVEGSDWDLVKQHLRPTFSGEIQIGSRTRYRLRIDVPRANPSERARVNAVNARICSASGERRLFVDPARAPHTMRDFDGVEADPAGDLVKPKKGAGALFTHLTDAVGYHVHRRYPLTEGRRVSIVPL